MTDHGRRRSPNTPAARPAAPGAAIQNRGDFSDGVRSFTVRASGIPAPDSFQVCANRNPAEVVLVISGLNTGELRATWGPQWRTASEGWRDWFEATAFMVFYNGRRPDFRRVRVCDG
ncbi:hypothetical protein [Glycomyces salinus]|uniref:hypothetical protein n=1 Tax=Glycomyces salinus TaxID=980294 RepID=UPI0018EB7911|nr:hypothetical protein [Glycomyces salinus]